MKANHLYVNRKQKFKATTNSNQNYPTAPNYLNQCFSMGRASMGKRYYQRSDESGLSYQTGVIDLFNRKIIRWALSDILNTEYTAIKAWQMAIKYATLHQPWIFHTDQGGKMNHPDMAKYYERFFEIIKTPTKSVSKSSSSIYESRITKGEKEVSKRRTDAFFRLK